MSEIEADRTALSRNIQRDNPDPVGLGYWLSRIMEKDPKIVYQKDLAKLVNKSEAWVSNLLTAYKQVKENPEGEEVDIAKLVLSAPTERHARVLRKAPPGVKNRVIEITRNGPWPSSREIERMTQARVTPKEFLEQHDPLESRFDNAFLTYRLSNNTGLTTREAQETVEKWRNYALPWQSLMKTRTTPIRPGDPEAQTYTKLADIYPTELIDLVEQVVKPKSFPTMQKYCKNAILLLIKKASKEIRQTVLEEIRATKH
jgi:hypothetical protein